MGALSKTWIKWIAVLLGVAGMLTPALLELGWIPRERALEALIFLFGFLVLDGAAARESGEQVEAPELFNNPDDFYHAMSGLLPQTRHEYMSIVGPNEITGEIWQAFMKVASSTIRREKQVHFYTILAGTLSEFTEDAFQRRFAIENDPALEGRWHYRVVDLPLTFGCVLWDQKHWAITFPSHRARPRIEAAILFKNHPDEARLVAAFLRHQWIEKPGVTMSLSEAYEKWKAIASTTAVTE